MKDPSNVKPRLFGKVTASVTHELQNVLAIIKENAGLMDDLLTLTPANEAEYLAQRLSRGLATIKKQVTRGVDLTSKLNGFAHTADHDFRTVDAMELAERLLSLTGRLANNAGITVGIDEPGGPARLDTDPVQLQACLFLGMECLFSVLPPGSGLSISFIGGAPVTGIDLTVLNTDARPETLEEALAASPPWTELIAALQPVNATCSPCHNGIQIRFA